MAKTKKKVKKANKKWSCNLKCVKPLLAVLAVVIVVAFTLIFVVGGGSSSIIPGPSGGDNNNTTPSGTVEVAIQNNAYSPVSVSISAGGSVKWTNYDDRRHFVTILDITNSGALQKGSSWTYTFGTPGTYQFRDDELPYMTGTVIVS